MIWTGSTSTVSHAVVARDGQIRRDFDCANELGVREIRERRDLGVHLRQHRGVSDERRADQGCVNSHRLTIFLDVETEVTEPNEESMEYAQASGSIPCGCVKEARYRRWLRRMRACEEDLRCVLISSA